MQHRRRRRLLPLFGAATVLVGGVAAGLVATAQADEAPAPTECTSSWYGATDENVEGAPTASGELFHVNQMTAASRDLPFGTVVQVKDKATGRSVKVRINDRGPFTDPAHRCIDITGAAFHALGEDLCKGLTDVSVQVLPAGSKEDAPDPSFKSISMQSCPPGSGAAKLAAAR